MLFSFCDPFFIISIYHRWKKYIKIFTYFTFSCIYYTSSSKISLSNTLRKYTAIYFSASAQWELQNSNYVRENKPIQQTVKYFISNYITQPHFQTVLYWETEVYVLLPAKATLNRDWCNVNYNIDLVALVAATFGVVNHSANADTRFIH